MKNWYFLFFFSFSLSCIPGCDHPEDRWYQEKKDLFHGIPVRVTFYPRNDSLAQEIWGYFDKIDDLFNDYRKDSAISMLHHKISSGSPSLTLPKEITEAIEQSLELYRLTEGAFDITISPLRDLWKRAEQENRLPQKEDITSILANCGLDKIMLEGNKIHVSSATIRFDFGGMIKGLAVDHVIRRLAEEGISAALIQIGGETAAFGVSRRGKPYIIGIQHPLDLHAIWTTVQDSGNGFSLSTSGNYYNPTLIEDKIFYHILDPRTGMPTSTSVLSVSVAFPEKGKNWLCDGLTTACAVLGPSDSIPIVEQLGGAVLFLVEKKGELQEITSDSWNRFFPQSE